MFPGAPEPWLDLSTGINPHPYPFSPPPASAFTRLPENAQMDAVLEAAAAYYGAPSARNIVAAPGTQIMLPHVAGLVAGGDAAILSPTYAEHRRAASLAGHAVRDVRRFEELHHANYAVVVNPNNPDGRVCSRRDLLELAGELGRRGGLLLVDEAFMDVGPRQESLVGDTGSPGLVVLRSFGKFFGLAGVRLGFAIGAEDAIARLKSILGPWAVPGPTLAIATEALRDSRWQTDMRNRLNGDSTRLDELLGEAGVGVVGGTSLFRLARHSGAAAVYEALGREGILVRKFDFDSEVLRVGLPGDDRGYDRLEMALARWRHSEGAK